jgi:hypothetical protein
LDLQQQQQQRHFHTSDIQNICGQEGQGLVLQQESKLADQLTCSTCYQELLQQCQDSTGQPSTGSTNASPHTLKEECCQLLLRLPCIRRFGRWAQLIQHRCKLIFGEKVGHLTTGKDVVHIFQKNLILDLHGQPQDEVLVATANTGAWPNQQGQTTAPVLPQSTVQQESCKAQDGFAGLLQQLL